jgi:uncharacterized membrane protein YgcG
MKHVFRGILTAIILTLSIGFGAYAQDPNDFTIESFHAKYVLGKDSEGRSTLKTTETIAAVFPESDQNHGLERAIPKKYDGHSTSLKIESVKNESGQEIPYSESTSNDNLVLRIGDADKYVHGKTTYVITYTQRDVTKFFQNTNADEFYWDVNGTQWQQMMNKVSMELRVSSNLENQLTNKLSCYRGIEGSTEHCTIEKNGNVFTAETGLGPYETMTVAVGFKPHTFTAYQPSLGEKILATLVTLWIGLQIIGSIIAISLIVWMGVMRHKVMNRVKGRGTIIPEYLPPKEASVLASAEVLGNSQSDITAQLIDFAVRHYIKIYQTQDKTVFKPAEYELEIIKDISDLRAEEKRLLEDLFGGSVATGSRFEMKKLQGNYSLSQKLLASRKALRGAVRGKYGLFERVEKEARVFKRIGIVTIIIGIVTLSPLVIVAAIVAFGIAYGLWPLTEKGVEIRDYLAGLKEYITVAEEDRIKMLQSPEGAEKVGVQVGEDTKQLVKLYERVLPYAVLFNVEKEWTKQLGKYYEQMNAEPDWYTGNTAFNAVIFASALSSFSSQSSSYSSSSSSSSGGSSGGGSSGGGGGGGGGGGW